MSVDSPNPLKHSERNAMGKTWTLFRRNDGTEVKVRDVLEQIVAWFRRFEKVGDAMASFDPVHAALPWAGVKFLIEVPTYHPVSAAVCR